MLRTRRTREFFFFARFDDFGARNFVGVVATVVFAVAEEALVDTLTIGTGELRKAAFS